MNDSAEQIDQAREAFARDGYVALPGFLSSEQLTEVQSNLDRFIREVVPGMPAEQAFYEDKDDKSTLKQIQDMFSYDPYFHRMTFGSRFEKWAERLLGGSVTAKNLQYFNKPPGIGQPTPPHQDGFYFKIEPCEAVTMWLALEKVDEENGCVRYVRGSHRRGMRPHDRTTTLGFSQGISEYGTPEDLRDEVAIPAQPGDLLIHDALAIHRADGNRSTTRTRRALGFVYYAAHCRTDAASVEAYQKSLMKDWAESGKI